MVILEETASLKRAVFPLTLSQPALYRIYGALSTLSSYGPAATSVLIQTLDHKWSDIGRTHEYEESSGKAQEGFRTLQGSIFLF